MSKTMLRIFAIIMIVLIVALSGCTGGDKEPAEVESTPETPPAATDTPATPVATQKSYSHRKKVISHPPGLYPGALNLIKVS